MGAEEDNLRATVEDLREKAGKWPGIENRKVVRPTRTYVKGIGVIAWYGGWLDNGWRGEKKRNWASDHVKLSYSSDGALIKCTLDVKIRATITVDLNDPNSTPVLEQLAHGAHQIAQYMSQLKPN